MRSWAFPKQDRTRELCGRTRYTFQPLQSVSLSRARPASYNSMARYSVLKGLSSTQGSIASRLRGTSNGVLQAIGATVPDTAAARNSLWQHDKRCIGIVNPMIPCSFVATWPETGIFAVGSDRAVIDLDRNPPGLDNVGIAGSTLPIDVLGGTGASEVRGYGAPFLTAAVDGRRIIAH